MTRTSATAILALSMIPGGAAVQPAAPPQTLSSPDPVLAVVNRTHEIHQSDVETWLRLHAPAAFARLRQDLYDSSRQAIDALVGDYLLSEDASSRGVSVEALLREQLDQAGGPPVRDEDVRDVYERSRTMMGNVTFDQAKSAISSYLEEERRKSVRQEYVNGLMADAREAIAIMLPIPRYDVPLAGDEPSLGKSSAAVTLVEYSDFQCPFCRNAAPDLRRIVETYSDDVRLVWRHFPLPGHPDARAAAEASACAGEQGTFWPYHDALFANQGSLGASDLGRYAEDVGLDMAVFDDCLESHQHEATLAGDLAAGTALGISATPAVFINGRLILGAVGYDAYKRVVEDELEIGRSQGRR